MVQGKCPDCKAYFQFNNGVKVVDVHRSRALCPKCGEQLMTTSKQMKKYTLYRLNIRTGKYIKGEPQEVYSNA